MKKILSAHIQWHLDAHMKWHRYPACQFMYTIAVCVLWGKILCGETNACAKRGSKFEGQNTGAIFMWALKIFYMQLINCSEWRTVPIWKSGFITLWKRDLLLNVTYLLVHSYKYGVTFLIRQHKHYVFWNQHFQRVEFFVFCFLLVLCCLNPLQFCHILLSFDCFSRTICLITAFTPSASK